MIRRPSRRSPKRTLRRAVTLIETLMAITIMGVVGASVLPLVVASGESYEVSASARSAMDRAGFALERCLRLVRETPGDIGTGDLDIAQATASSAVFTDGRGLRLDGSDLLLLDDGGGESVLCRDVQAFEIRYLDEDSISDVSATPERTHRFEISITTGGLELRGVAFVRLRMVPQS